MQFTAPVSINDAMRILESNQREFAGVTDTAVEISSGDRGASGAFTVRRRWAARRGEGGYTAMSLKGTLARVDETQTGIEARVEYGVLAYVILAFAIIVPLIGVSSPDAGIYWMISIIIFLPLLFDAFMLLRVIAALRSGTPGR